MRNRLLAVAFGVFATTLVAQDDAAILDRWLASSFGGVTQGDEVPAFGDPELQTLAFQGDSKFDDGMRLHGELRGDRHVRIAIVWGYLRPHPDATEGVDWSGSLTATNAAVRVLRLLRFEEQDVILRPRTDVHVIEFESQTGPHADGLLLEVFIAPALNPDGAPVTLTFDMPMHRDTVTIEPGMRLSRIASVDQSGHVVAYQIIQTDAGGCAEGFVRGIWRASTTTDGREVGVIKGKFTADDGRLQGHLRGVFGQRQNGHQVWFAKVVDDEGEFLGVVAGRYGDGRLAGLVVGPGGKIRGVWRGRYGDSTRDGGFIGRYSRRCSEDEREGERIEDDEPVISLEDDDR